MSAVLGKQGLRGLLRRRDGHRRWLLLLRVHRVDRNGIALTQGTATRTSTARLKVVKGTAIRCAWFNHGGRLRSTEILAGEAATVGVCVGTGVRIGRRRRLHDGRR